MSSFVRSTLIIAILLSPMVACAATAAMWSGSSFDKLPESATAEAQAFAVVFDFDTDSCYPSPAISKDGAVSGGLKPSGDITGECRDAKQLEDSNTYYRSVSIRKGDVEYKVHMFALYFKKDQWAWVNPFGKIGIGAGHRHDWEFALVWTTNGNLAHASYSAHGKVVTEEKSRLHFDEADEHVKIVYHKDDLKTHTFRFAKPDEKAENNSKRWITPTVVDWHTMKSDVISNRALRSLLNDHDFGEANCPVNDKNFPNEIAKNPPSGYPTGEEWKAAVAAE